MRSDGLQVILRPLWRRILSLVGRARITRVDDGSGLQKLQVAILSTEVRDALDVLAQFGFASRPLEGGEAMVLFLGGNRDNGVVIATDDRRYRPQDLEPGEAAVWTPGGSRVHLKANGDVEVRPSGGGVVRVFGDAIVQGDVRADGDVHADGDVSDGATSPGVTLEQIRQLYNLHTHVHGTGPGTTAPPIPTL